MSTATDERVEVVLDVDLDAIVPCTITHAGCPNEAAWALPHSCGHELRACVQHRDLMDEAVAEMSRDGIKPGCFHCHTSFPQPLPWRPL